MPEREREREITRVREKDVLIETCERARQKGERERKRERVREKEGV